MVATISDSSSVGNTSFKNAKVTEPFRSYRISISNVVRFEDLPISHRSSDYHCLLTTTAWFSPCLGKEYNPLNIHFVSFYGEVQGRHSDKVYQCRVNSVTAEKPRHDLFIALGASNISKRNVVFEQ